jgi:hypothetical protein
MLQLTKALSVLCSLALLASAGAVHGACSTYDIYILNGIINTSQRVLTTNTQLVDCCGFDSACVGCIGSQSYRFWADVYEMDVMGNWVVVYSIAGCTDDVSDDTWYKVNSVQPGGHCATLCKL